MKSVMKHQFSQVPRTEIQRSNFNRSHGYKTTFNSGYLVPIYVDEVLPGDTFNCKATLFSRLATPIVPIMDNLFMETFFFAVPIRLIWDNWQRFNGEQDNPGDSTDYLIPQITAPVAGWPVGSLSDYFGLPTGILSDTASPARVCAFWHRAYNLVWNEWFRDQNLQDSVSVSKDDGPDDDSDYVLLRRGKRHDYFTSCLPWPQKGPGVELPVGGQAPVYGSGQVLGLEYNNGTMLQRTGLSQFRDLTISAGYNVGTDQFSYYPNIGVLYGSNPAYGQRLDPPIAVPPTNTSHNNFPTEMQSPYRSSGLGVVQKPGISGLYADLSEATAVTINSFRQAFQIQRLLERDARGGTRYTEILRSHFGVVSPDARLQRPEFLGGGSTRVIVNPVQQTSSTDTTSPQGNLAAYGVAADSGHGFVKSFVEHSVIIGLVNVRADLTYQQGLPRMFSRRTRWDFYWPALAHLGEQAVLNKEIYFQGPRIVGDLGPIDDEVFGYQERWAEYRYFPSQITGKFRSTYPQSLDVWHLSQKFNNLPRLSSQFIQDTPPITRVIAVQDEPEFLLDCYFDLNCARPMPVYSVPGLVDHF